MKISGLWVERGDMHRDGDPVSLLSFCKGEN